MYALLNSRSRTCIYRDINNSDPKVSQISVNSNLQATPKAIVLDDQEVVNRNSYAHVSREELGW